MFCTLVLFAAETVLRAYI